MRSCCSRGSMQMLSLGGGQQLLQFMLPQRKSGASAVAVAFSSLLQAARWQPQIAATGATGQLQAWLASQCTLQPIGALGSSHAAKQPHSAAWHSAGRCFLHTSTGAACSGRHHAAPKSGGLPAGSTSGPLAVYQQRRQEGLYRADPRQELTVSMLQDLWDTLHSGMPRPRKLRGQPSSGLTMVDSLSQPDSITAAHGKQGSHKHAGKHAVSSSTSSKRSKPGFWAGVSSFLSGEDSVETRPAVGPLHSGPHVQGLYMHGGVGCGKTMLMDLFVSTATPSMQVQRTHYHDFMLSVHEKLRSYKGDVDPLLRVADSLAKRARVLALDEFFVTDVADAMILARLFGRLWDRGCVLVATSNRAPDDLYKGGLQRQWFLPFIDRLKVECVCHDMASRVDYRKLAQHQRGLYFTAHNRHEELVEEFEDCTEGAPVQPVTLPVQMGRTITVQRAAGLCAFMSFDELCNRPLAAADYIALAKQFHTLAVSDVPLFTAHTVSAAHRFVTLVDVMYDLRVRMLVSAETNPFGLFENIITVSDAMAHPELKVQPRVVVDDKLGFSKDRTISRLTEMQSLEYLIAHAQMHAPELLLALQEAQAKDKAAAGDTAAPAEPERMVAHGS